MHQHIFKLIFGIFFVFISICSFVYASDQQLILQCGGDEELIIGCIGDSENSFIYQLTEETKSYLIAYITTNQNLVKTQNSTINITLYRQGTDNTTDIALFSGANITANITTPSGAIENVNFTNLGNGNYTLNYPFSNIGTYKVKIRARADYYGYVEAQTYIYVGRFPIYAKIIGSTEYQAGEEGEISLRVVDADDDPITGGSAVITIFYPDKTLFVDELAMTELQWGIYYYNFTVPSTTGIYITYVNFTSGANSAQDSHTFHVAPWTTTITEINQTVHDIYNLLLNDMNLTLTRILNYTTLTYENVTELSSEMDSLISKVNNLRTYLEGKWGREDADEIIDKLEDVNGDLAYLKSQYYYLSESGRESLLLSIKEDSRKVIDLLYKKDKWYENLWIWVIPGVIAILIIIVVIYLIKRRKPKRYEEVLEEIRR